MEKQAESKTTIKVLPGDGLALALALPRVPVESVRQSLLSRLPFLGLDRHGRRSVWGTVSGVGLSMAIPWPGPRGFSWPSYPQTVAAEAPPATHLSTESMGSPVDRGEASGSPSTRADAMSFHNNQASTAGFPAIGLMISGTAKQQAGTGGAPPNGGRLSTQKLSPALFGILSQNGGRFATKVTAQKRVPDDSSASVGLSSIAPQEHIPFGVPPTPATHPFSVATSPIQREWKVSSSSAIMMSRLELTQTTPASIENRLTGSQPAPPAFASSERFSWPAPPSDRRHALADTRPRELTTTFSSSQPANNTGRAIVHADPGTGTIYRSENTPTMEGSIVNRITAPLPFASSERFSVPTTPSERRHRPSATPPRELATTPSSESVGSVHQRLPSAPIGPMNILRLLPALRLNSPIKPDLPPSGSRRVPAGNHMLQRDGFDSPFHKAGATKARSASRAVRDGLPTLGSSSIYSTVYARDANKQKQRVLPEPEVWMSQREVDLRQGLTVMADAVEVMVQREVKAAVERQVDATMSQVSRSAPLAVGIKAADFVSDEIARALMQKMRDLAQEDRFRCGKLR